MISRLFDEETHAEITKTTPKKVLIEYQTIGGVKLTGVDFNYFKDLLNKFIGVGNWGFKPHLEHIRFEKTENHPSCFVPVTCYIYRNTPEAGEVSTDIVWQCTNVGTAYYPTQMLQGDMVKAAIADGVKKTFSILGFCKDVYEGKTVLESTTQGKKKGPRTGTTKIKAAEDKEKVKAAKKKMKEIVSAAQEKVKAKKETEKISKVAEKLLKFNTAVFVQLANEALIKAVANGDKKVEFDIKEKINAMSDLYTLYEWKLAIEMLQTWVNKILEAEGLVEDDKDN